MSALPFKQNQHRRRHIPEQKRKVTNWRDYDESLRRRGSLTVWFSDEAVEAWEAERRTSRGGQPEYSDLAILTALTFKAVFRLAYRQTEGLVWTPPPVQEESLDSCGAGSGAAMCPASAAAAHRPRARMGVRGSGPHHRSALEALSLCLVLLIPPHRRLRHTCPSTSSHHRQPHARRPLMRRRPELDNFRPWRSTPTRSAPSCWPAPR